MKCEYHKDEYCHNNYDKWENVIYCMKENCSLFGSGVQPEEKQDDIREAFEEETFFLREVEPNTFDIYSAGYKSATQKAKVEIEELTVRMEGYKKNNELLLAEHITDLRTISELEQQLSDLQAKYNHALNNR